MRDNFVGTMAVEVALGVGVEKGISALSKTTAGRIIGVEAVALGKYIEQTIGKIPISTAVQSVEIALADGSRIKMPVIEAERLGDLVTKLESRAKQALSGTAESPKVKPVNLPSWEKLTIRLEADGTPHLISNHKIDGKGYLQSLKDGGAKDPFPAWMSDKQIMSAVKEAYGNAKKMGVQNFKDGKVLTLEGTSNGIKIRIHLNIDLKQIESAYPIKGGVK